MKLTTSKADALKRLTAVIPYVPFPYDNTRTCRKGLGAVLGEELVTAQWSRLTAPMCEWVSKVLYLLPVTPWGAKGGGMAALAAQLSSIKERAHETREGNKVCVTAGQSQDLSNAWLLRSHAFDLSLVPGSLCAIGSQGWRSLIRDGFRRRRRRRRRRVRRMMAC